MSEWQPIETAPKDGTPFLGTGHDFGDTKEPRHFCVCTYDGDMIDTSTDEVLSFIDFWMPIPYPPQLDDAD